MSDEIEPHIYKKFEVLQRLGKGAYGIVWKVVERKTKQTMALKKVFDAFHNDTDAQRTFREVMILQELDHPNMVKLLNVIKAENNKDLYLVFEYVETDLHSVIRAGILEEIHKEFIIYQMLCALLYLHSAEIIHRDLKPSNILINSECKIKLADFGLARSVLPCDDETAPIMTEYVATRWYRAPEIVLGSTHYSKAVDMWSVGCILGELITGKAIFPGKSTLNQIELILDLLGKPKPEDLEDIGGATDWNIINSINSKQKYTFTTFFKGASKYALDFLKKCLEFNPRKRITVEQALEHPYVAQFHKPETEIRAPKIIEIPISDQKKLSIKEYREALYADIIKKKKEQRRAWQLAYLNGLGINVAEESPTNGTKISTTTSQLPSQSTSVQQSPAPQVGVKSPVQSAPPVAQQQAPMKTTTQQPSSAYSKPSSSSQPQSYYPTQTKPAVGVMEDRGGPAQQVVTKERISSNGVGAHFSSPTNGVGTASKPGTASQPKPKEPPKQIASPKNTQPGAQGQNQTNGKQNMHFEEYINGLFKK